MNQVFEVTDVFQIKGRGFVAVGITKEGTFRVGDTVKVKRGDRIVKSALIKGIELIYYGSHDIERKDVLGFLLSDIYKDDVLAGDFIVNAE